MTPESDRFIECYVKPFKEAWSRAIKDRMIPEPPIKVSVLVNKSNDGWVLDMIVRVMNQSRESSFITDSLDNVIKIIPDVIKNHLKEMNYA